MTRRYLALILILALTGCASFSGPGYFTGVPYREPVVDRQNFSGMGVGQLYVSVRVLKGFEDNASNGWCDLPDASNEISCQFSLSRLDSYPMAPAGYRYLSLQAAREMCGAAVWSLGRLASPAVVGACSRALMMHRWIEDAEVYDPEAGS